MLKSKITTHQRRHKNVTSILLPEGAGSGGVASTQQKKMGAGQRGGDEPAATSSFTRRDAKGHAKGKAKNKQNPPVFVLFFSFFIFQKQKFLKESGFVKNITHTPSRPVLKEI